jgi:hypothetical protein
LRRKFVRERFAFFATATICSLCSACILPLLNGESIVSITLKSLDYQFDLNINLGQSDAVSQTILIIMIAFVIWMAHSIHKNWDGAISKRHYENKKYNRPESGLIEEALVLIMHKLKNDEELKPFSSDDEKKEKILIEVQDEKIAWHEQVADLLMLYSKQYKILKDDDWYAEHSIYVSSYGKNNSPLGIYCVLEKPNDNNIIQFIEFVKEHNSDVKNFIVAVKNGNDQRDKVEIDGYTIDMRFEKELMDGLIDFSEYKDSIIKQYENDEIMMGCNTTIQDIYVEPTCSNRNRETFNNIETYVADWSRDSKHNKQLAILGKYGQGKSVLSLKLAYEMLKNSAKDARIPILIILRGTSPRNMKELDILATFASKYGIDPRALLKFHKAGKLLLIFDGFDEMDLAGDLEMRMDHFRSLWKLSIPKAKILITGRPNLFFDIQERERALGTGTKERGYLYCEEIHLELFSRQQIKKALRKTPQKNKVVILNLIEKGDNHRNFTDLISRPSVLFMVSQIWDSEKIEKYKNSMNSATVINEFINYAFERQNLKFSITDPSVLNNIEREYFMMGIAVGMIKKNGYTNQIHKSDLKDLVNQLYHSFPNELSEHYTTHSKKDKPLKNRMAARDWDEDATFTDIRTNGLIVDDVSRFDHFKFSHKSFLEYFMAVFETTKCGTATQLQKIMCDRIGRIFKPPCTIPDEVLSLVTQLIIRQVANRHREENISSIGNKVRRTILGRRHSIVTYVTDWFLYERSIKKRIDQTMTSKTQTKINATSKPAAARRSVRSEVEHRTEESHGLIVSVTSEVAWKGAREEALTRLRDVLMWCSVVMLILGAETIMFESAWAAAGVLAVGSGLLRKVHAMKYLDRERVRFADAILHELVVGEIKRNRNSTIDGRRPIWLRRLILIIELVNAHRTTRSH